MPKTTKFKILLASLAVVFTSMFAVASVPHPAMAACAADEVQVTISLDGKTNCIKKGSGSNVNQNAIYTWLILIIRFLSAGVGIAVVGGIVYGGIMYMTARDNAGQTQKAVTIIVNAVIGLLLYIFLFAIINFLVPGGILT